MAHEEGMIGRSLAHYRIVQTLGAGGMGEVYLAEDTKLGRKVALKLLPPDLATDPDRLARLRQEASAIASLNHPNVITLYAFEEIDDQRFLVMELMSGQNLSESIPEDGLPTKQFFELAIPLASAIAAAHEAGVIHRDLKPSNVMVARDGTLKVLDFGLAKAHTESEDKTLTIQAPLSIPGSVLGTVPYMSPEQAQGKSVDHRSDIFSLGVMLYEMATGARPFRGDNSASVVSAILRDTPPPLTDVRPKLPPRLGRLVARCLEKDPQRRFQSALDLRNELEDLNLETSEASGITGSVIPEPPRTRRVWWLLAAVTTIAIAATLYFRIGPDSPSGTTVDSEPTRRMVVVFPFENLGPPQHDYFVAGLTEEITSRLAMIGSVGVISRTSALQYDRSGKSIEQIGADLGVSYILEGTVRWAQGSSSVSRVRVTPHLVEVAHDSEVWSKSYDEELVEIFSVQSDIAEQVIQELDLTLVESERQALRNRPTDNLDAYQSYLRGLDNATRDYYLEANHRATVELYRNAVDLDPDFALAWTALSMEHSYIYHLRFDTTDERRADARRAVDRALQLRPEMPEAHLALGLYYYRCFRDYDNALAELSIARHGLPNDAELFMALGAVRRRQGQWQESARLSNRAVLLNPRDATQMWDLGITYMSMRQYEKADSFIDRSIGLDPGQTPAYAMKALNLWNTGDLAAARAALEGMPGTGDPLSEWVWFGQEIYEGDYPAALRRAESFPVEMIAVPTMMMPRVGLEASTHDLIGNTARARELWQQARGLLEQEVERHPDDARAHLALGIALAALGLHDEAIREGEHGVQLYPVSVDAFHGPNILINLARIYTRVGESAAALDLIEQLLTMPSGISVALLEMEPDWAPLRDEPRYRALIAANSPTSP